MRFEIFKRDGFTCQYCGGKAPDVILEIDHVKPISKGGKTNMLNLVTSCYECNRGKSNIKLSDNSVIERQKKSLQELNEKQEQLKMLLKWRSGLLNIENQEIKSIQETWSRLTGYQLNENGILKLKKLLKDFGFLSVIEAMEITTKYLQYKKGKVTKDSVEIAWNKIKGVCYIRSLPEDKRIEYQKIGSLKKLMQMKYYNMNIQWAAIKINLFLKSGNSLDELEQIVRNCMTYREWEDKIQEYL